MRTIFYLLSGAFLMVLLLQCNSDEKALNKRLTQMAVELNESTPVMLDQYTRFDKASVVSGNMFQYQYTVLNTENPDSLVDIGLQSLRENIRHEFSTNPQLAVFKENNVVLEYVYKDNNDRTIRTLRIDPEEYQ